MKMMDVNGEDDCSIEAVTPAKKKKMKQAQLSFQMPSPIQSPNVTQGKKRKLPSPSVDCKSSKAVKMPKKSLSKSDEDIEPSKENISATNNDNDIIGLLDANTENVKENTTSNKVERKSKNETPRRTSTGQRQLDKQEKLRSSPLTKFLQKADKQEENSKVEAESLKEEAENSKEEAQNSKEKDQNSKKTAQNSKEVIQNFVEKENKSNKLIKEDCIETETANTETEAAADVDAQSISNLDKTLGDSLSAADNSLCQSDSDIAILSSDNEEKEEEKKEAACKEKNEADSPDAHKTPKMDRMKQKKLTPKQQEKKLLSAKKKEERQRLKMEKEKKLEEERQNRRKEREEKRREKEEREKAEKEQKMMEKKLKEQKKQMEIEQKQKEKQVKEEERRKREEAKEEERKKKEEEKLEAERKKQKAASNFTSFFVAKKQEKSVEDESTTEVKNFMPFEVKADMKVAPICRRTLSEQEKSLLDENCNKENIKKSSLYLNEIKDKRVIPRKSSRTWPLEAKDDEVIILDEENDGSSNIVNQNIVVEKQRPKLLQFSENQRPPYWGTWRKKSKNINPRRPFSKDPDWFNYEIDSDEEWEEEEPGESLRGSDDEKDEENPEDNEYDVDNEFMVPHGYLSDEELRADEEDKEDMSPETQKFKLKALGEQFESERNAKTSKLKPKIVGCIWRGLENKFPPNIPQKIIDFLSAREAWVRQIPVTLPTVSESEHAAASECNTPTQQQAWSGSKKTKVPETALPDLIRLIHGNTHGRRFLVKEFMSYWEKKEENRISKVSLSQKIRELGKWRPCPEEGPMHLRACWYVPEKIRKQYIEDDLPLPNRWSYNLSPKRKTEFLETLEKLEKEDKDKEKDKKNVPLITQFTKKITQEEMKKQLTAASTPRNKLAAPSQGKSTATTLQNKAAAKPPKRATLISVARGEQFPKSSKEGLLKSFVGSAKSENKESNEQKNDSDDVIILDDSDKEESADRKESSDRKEASDKKVKEDKLTDKKEDEDRLVAVVPMECDEQKGEVKSASNSEIEILVPEAKIPEKNVSDKNVKGAVDTSMDVDGDD